MDNTHTTWRLSKSITWGHVLSTLAMSISVFLWVSSVDKRIEQNTQAIAYIKDEHTKEQQRLEADLRAINAKLDRLVEYRNQG